MILCVAQLVVGRASLHGMGGRVGIKWIGGRLVSITPFSRGDMSPCVKFMFYEVDFSFSQITALNG